jgi:pimeloyl-ACP methyl ester carboxylesterase
MSSRFAKFAVAMGVTGAVLSTEPAGSEPAPVRDDFRVVTSDGVGIHVREIRPASRRHAEPLILIHGARVPGIASFDLDVPNGSLAADLALLTARNSFVMDARGYGGSDRPDAMSHPPRDSRPLSRAFEVVRDIDAVVRAALKRTGAKHVVLLGWATGGMWAAYYASLWPERVSQLITMNALYGGSDRHRMLGPGSPAADTERPDRLRADIGGYALNDAASLWPSWDNTIPIADKSAWRSPEVAAAYARAALASDPQSESFQPSAFRAPMGAIEDSFYQASGRRLFDSSSITAGVLIIRSEHDFWSRPEDAESFAHDAVHARTVRVVTLQDATHYVHLDRPERGRDALLREIAAFLEQPAQPAESN